MKYLFFILLLLTACTVVNQAEVITCEDTNYGFTCGYNQTAYMENHNIVSNNDYWDIPQSELNKDWEPINAKCEDLGGYISCNGFCMPNYGRICVTGYSDKGKYCVKDSDCLGYCKMEYEVASELQKQYFEQTPAENGGHALGQWIPCENCTGECSEKPYDWCDNTVQLDNQSFRKENVICD